MKAMRFMLGVCFFGTSLIANAESPRDPDSFRDGACIPSLVLGTYRASSGIPFVLTPSPLERGRFGFMLLGQYPYTCDAFGACQGSGGVISILSRTSFVYSDMLYSLTFN